MPIWLVRHKPGGRFPRKSFLKSRVIFYPCSGTDGHPLETFAKAHAAHCFVYADWRFVSLEDVRSQLLVDEHPERPKGYQCITFKVMPIEDFIPAGWAPTFSPGDRYMEYPEGGAFVVWSVLERKEGLDDSHGPKRISLLHIGYEYVAVFERIFCQEVQSVPYAVVMDQPYGNWTNLGGEECLMARLIRHYDLRFPAWMLVATHVSPWHGYMQRSESNSCQSGLNPKALYELGNGGRDADRCVFVD